MAITVKMGKRGTVVLPARLRKQFGIEDGSLLQVEAVDGRISIKPSFACETEVWSPQRKAYLLLMNTLTREEYDRVAASLKAEGVDPTKVADLDARYRESLPTEKGWHADRSRRVAELKREHGLA